MTVKLKVESGSVANAISGKSYQIEGNSTMVEGTIKFDGFTTGITIAGADAVEPSTSFTLSAWIAPQAYPWNWCSVIGRDKDDGTGFLFGIDAEGHIGLHLFAAGESHELITESTVPYMQSWSHIAATLDKTGRAKVFVDGEVQAESILTTMPDLAAGEPILIGRNSVGRAPAALVREWLAVPSILSFDGLIDNVQIHDEALTPEEISALYQTQTRSGPPSLKWRKLPVMKASGTFRAFYTRLDFYPEWDALWRVADHPDVVVEFPNGLGHAVFWRGTNYNMNLVTENGKWVGDQSAETGANWELSEGRLSDLPTGCMEHMSDKQNRYAHVRIVENTPARVVVHWRYALVDVFYRIAEADPTTGWGTWADEYYYIYPNGTCVRSACVHGSGGEYSLTEPATFNQPGEKAEDNVDIAAVSVMNMEGESDTYRWEPWPTVNLEDANICVVNFKSESKPFYIFEEGAFIGPYGAPSEQRPEYSVFPTWNHWPVSQVPSDGRYALAPDRVSSSAVLSPEAGFTVDSGGRSRARFLMGLTDHALSDLLPLASFWLAPPSLTCEADSFAFDGYSRDQCAYLLHRVTTGPFQCSLPATKEKPVVCLVLVLRDWGEKPPTVTIEGEAQIPGEQYHAGLVHSIDGTDLILNLTGSHERPLSITVA